MQVTPGSSPCPPLPGVRSLGGLAFASKQGNCCYKNFPTDLRKETSALETAGREGAGCPGVPRALGVRRHRDWV